MEPCSAQGHPSSDSGASQSLPEFDRISRLLGVPVKLGRLGDGKTRTRLFLDYLDSLPESQPVGRLRHWIPGMRHCADRIQVAAVPASDRVSYSTQFCRHHLACQACAIARGGRQMGRAMRRIALLDQADQLHWYMVTLTIKNGPDLAERYRHLASSMRALRQRARFKRAGSYFKHFLGGMGSVEFKIGSRSGQWHPHLHALMCSDHELPGLVDHHDAAGRESTWAAEFAAEWKSITGDSHIHDIHPLRFGADGFMGGLAEVFKYAVKVGELDHGRRLAAAIALTGRRLLSTWGVFYGQGIDDEPWAGPDVRPGDVGAQVYDYEFQPAVGGYNLVGFAAAAAYAVGGWDPVKESCYVEEQVFAG